jgi:hypothetical protein
MKKEEAIKKLNLLLQALDEVYNSPLTGESNKILIEKWLKKIHEKPAQRISK